MTICIGTQVLIRAGKRVFRGSVIMVRSQTDLAGRPFDVCWVRWRDQRGKRRTRSVLAAQLERVSLLDLVAEAAL